MTRESPSALTNIGHGEGYLDHPRHRVYVWIRDILVLRIALYEDFSIFFHLCTK